MSAPPFCPIGKKYTYRFLNALPSGYLFSSNSGNAVNTYTSSGWSTTFSGNYVTAGRYTIARDTAQRIYLGNTTWTFGANFSNWQPGCGFGITNQLGYTIIIDTITGNDKDIGGGVTGTNTDYDTDFNFEITRNGNNLYAYINGNLSGTGNALVNGWSTSYLLDTFSWGSQDRTTGNFTVTGAILEDIYWIGDDGENFCQGEIPTAHREIVSSTAKISHSRIIQEERTLIGAQNFHNIMKDL